MWYIYKMMHTSSNNDYSIMAQQPKEGEEEGEGEGEIEIFGSKLVPILLIARCAFCRCC